jgi:hypothetical protein
MSLGFVVKATGDKTIDFSVQATREQLHELMQHSHGKIFELCIRSWEQNSNDDTDNGILAFSLCPGNGVVWHEDQKLASSSDSQSATTP